MPIIRLPDAMRDVITSALGNDLGRRIEKGRAVAVFTFQYAETGEHEYLVEFKSAENAKTLASYQGHSQGAQDTEAVPLYPHITDQAQGFGPGHRHRRWRFRPAPHSIEGRRTGMGSVSYSLRQGLQRCILRWKPKPRQAKAS